MTFPAHGTIHCLKQSPDMPGAAGTASRSVPDTRTDLPQGREPITCRACRHPITRTDECISVQGGHEHTFANPHGIVFRIGCFGAADGCGYLGPPTFEFTWFSGFQWRIALCLNCMINLGWLFTAPIGQRFHGLILDRLVFPKP
jgi:hypothetical protein